MTLKKLLCLIAVLTLTVFATVSCSFISGLFGGDNPGNTETTLTGIYIVDSTVPEKCMKGDIIDTSAIKVMAVYSDNTEKEISATDIQFRVSDTSEAVKATITATYNGFSDTAEVSVVDLRGVLVTKLMGNDYNSNIKKLRVNVEVGAVIDYSDLVLELTYSDGSKSTLNYSQDAGIKVNIPETTTPGEYPITVEYSGLTSADDRCVLIVSNSIVSVEFVEGSVSNLFTVTSKQDASSLQLLVTYADGSSVIKTKDDGVEVSKIDTSAVGNFSYTATFGGKTVEIPYTVISDVILTNISVDTSTFAISYKIGDVVSPLENMKLVISYSDGYTKDMMAIRPSDYEGEVYPITITGYEKINTAKVGEYTLTVNYNDGVDNKRFNITVEVIDFSDIVVEGLESKKIAVGDTFTTDDIIVKALYSDGEEIVVEGFEVISNVNTAVEGVYTVTVKYGSFEKVFTITVGDYEPDTDSGDNVTPEVPLG